MHPILFQIAGFPIPTFGVLLALAFLLGGLWFVHRGGQAGFSKTVLMDAFPWVIISAIMGARLLYLIYYPQQFLADPMGMAFGQGGLVWYGGVAGALLAILIICKKYNIRFWQWMDWLLPPATLGLAIGRLGCFFAGCCFGGPCDINWLKSLAVQYPAGHETHPYLVHPAPLYASGLALLLMVTLITIEKRFKPPVGTIAAYGFMGYALIRFGLEYVRADRLIWLETLDLSASQVMSLGLFAVVGIVLIIKNQTTTHTQKI